MDEKRYRDFGIQAEAWHRGKTDLWNGWGQCWPVGINIPIGSMYATFSYNSLINLYNFLRTYMDAMRLDSLVHSLVHIVYIDTVSFSWGGVCFGSFFVLVSQVCLLICTLSPCITEVWVYCSHCGPQVQIYMYKLREIYMQYRVYAVLH